MVTNWSNYRGGGCYKTGGDLGQLCALFGCWAHKDLTIWRIDILLVLANLDV